MNEKSQKWLFFNILGLGPIIAMAIETSEIRYLSEVLLSFLLYELR